jgi:hypothetical protein
VLLSVLPRLCFLAGGWSHSPAVSRDVLLGRYRQGGSNRTSRLSVPLGAGAQEHGTWGFSVLQFLLFSIALVLIRQPQPSSAHPSATQPVSARVVDQNPGLLPNACLLTA